MRKPLDGNKELEKDSIERDLFIIQVIKKLRLRNRENVAVMDQLELVQVEKLDVAQIERKQLVVLQLVNLVRLRDEVLLEKVVVFG